MKNFLPLIKATLAIIYIIVGGMCLFTPMIIFPGIPMLIWVIAYPKHAEWIFDIHSENNKEGLTEG